MNKKEAIELIKNATKAVELFFTGEDKPVEKFEAFKLKEGDQMVSIQGELAKGTAVEVSSAMGSQDAPDSTYELSNGVSFSTKGGKIDKVISTGENADAKEEKLDDEADSSKESEDMAVENAPEVVPADEVKEASADATNTMAIQTLVDKINELEGIIKNIQGSLPDMPTKSDMSAFQDELKSFQKAVEVLAGTPEEFSKVDKSVVAKEEKANRLEALAGLVSKIK